MNLTALPTDYDAAALEMGKRRLALGLAAQLPDDITDALDVIAYLGELVAFVARRPPQARLSDNVTDIRSKPRKNRLKVPLKGS